MLRHATEFQMLQCQLRDTKTELVRITDKLIWAFAKSSLWIQIFEVQKKKCFVHLFLRGTGVHKQGIYCLTLGTGSWGFQVLFPAPSQTCCLTLGESLDSFWASVSPFIKWRNWLYSQGSVIRINCKMPSYSQMEKSSQQSPGFLKYRFSFRNYFIYRNSSLFNRLQPLQDNRYFKRERNE